VRLEVKLAGVSVHVRQTADPAASAATLRPILKGVAEREELQLESGRMVLELRPPVRIDKGVVIRRLAAQYHPSAIVYAGDDRTDIDAFRALRSLRAESVQTLAVGIRSHEVPPETFGDCDVVLNGVAGTISLLRQLSALQPAA
jgi:trehalose 6-phosphate phosphatase